MLKKLIFSLILCLMVQPDVAFAKIVLDITRASNNSFPMAIDLPFPENRKDKSMTVEDTFRNTLQSDLNALGVFRFIHEKAFLEKSSDKKFDASRIDFANWAVLDALALVKVSYAKRSDGTFTVHARLFDVLAKVLLREKKYSGSIASIDIMAHRFADVIVETLTGQEGLFNSQIAFICKPQNDKELCTMDMHGKNVSQITRDRSIVLSPAWDKRGRKLYYSAFKNSKKPNIYAYDLQNKQHTPLLPIQNKGMTIGLDVDPLGQYFATSLTKDGNSEIYLFTQDKKVPRRVTQNFAEDVSPSFSPDGQRIAFISDRNGTVQIFIVSRHGGIPKQITFKGKDNTSPVWSPDGKKIAFAGRDSDGEFDIFTFDVDQGTQPVRLTYDSKDNIDPTWSPGGHLIAFSSNRSGTYQIWTMRQDGSNQQRISKKSSWHHSMPKWGPNQ